MVEHLDRAILSVWEQTYQNIELVLIDDGSTDEFTKLKMNSITLPNTKVILQEEWRSVKS